MIKEKHNAKEALQRELKESVDNYVEIFEPVYELIKMVKNKKRASQFDLFLIAFSTALMAEIEDSEQNE